MKTVTNVHTVIDLLRLHSVMRLKEITLALGLENSRVWNLLNAMRKAGFLIKVGAGRYSLAPSFQTPQKQVLHVLPTHQIRTIVENSVEEIRESMTVVTLNGHNLEIVCECHSDQAIAVNPSRIPCEDELFEWATGHVLLSQLTPAYRHPFMQKKLVRTPSFCEETFETYLGKITRKELAELHFEDLPIHSIAVPAIIPHGPPLAVGAYLPDCRLSSREHCEKTIDVLRNTAAHISRLNY